MKKIISTLTMLFLLTCFSIAQNNDFTMDSIKFWTGNGSNRAALVVKWCGDGKSPETLVWGYRWDGTASTLDMIEAIADNDPRFFFCQESNSTLGGIGYDLNNNGNFALIENGSSQNIIYADSNNRFPNSATYDYLPLDPADHWKGDFSMAFWYLSNGAVTTPISDDLWSSCIFIDMNSDNEDCNSFNADVSFDEMTAAEPPIPTSDTCATPSELYFSILDSNSVSLHWKGESFNYFVTCAPENGMEMNFSVQDTFLVIHNICQNISYSWQVQAICESEDTSSIAMGNCFEIINDKICENNMGSVIISLAPNPAINYTNILISGLSGKISLAIHNINGENIYSDSFFSNGNINKPINIQNFQNGIYFISIQKNNFQKTIKLIIQ